MRIKRAVNAVKKRRKILKLSKGYFGAKSKLYRVSREAVMKSLMYAYIGRKNRKRDFRQYPQTFRTADIGLLFLPLLQIAPENRPSRS